MSGARTARRWRLAPLLLLASCGRPDSPTGAVRRLIEAADRGDRAAALAMLAGSTRARLEPQLARAAEMAGRRALSPDTLLAVGWAPARERLSSLLEVERQGGHAVVELRGPSGARERLSLVREVGAWRVELP